MGLAGHVQQQRSRALFLDRGDMAALKRYLDP